MRAVLQRVNSGSVTIAGSNRGTIGAGLVILIGFGQDDDETAIKWLCRKILQLRIFEDDKGKMNRSITDIAGELLVIPQFTLYADCRRGNRPDFIKAMPPQVAEELYDRFVRELRESGLRVETGQFASYMQVGLINEGPVTIIIESSDQSERFLHHSP